MSDIKIVAGEQNWSTTDGTEEVRGAGAVYMHPYYHPNAFAGFHDLALVRLDSGLTPNNRVQPIRPAFDGDDSGQDALLTGFGLGGAERNTLMYGTMPIVPNSSCNMAPDLPRDLDENELCAGYETGTVTACGDDGAPLSVARVGGNRELVGIVSWGGAVVSSSGGVECGSTYTVFSRVTKHVDWIRKYVYDPALVSTLY